MLPPRTEQESRRFLLASLGVRMRPARLALLLCAQSEEPSGSVSSRAPSCGGSMRVSHGRWLTLSRTPVCRRAGSLWAAAVRRVAALQAWDGDGEGLEGTSEAPCVPALPGAGSDALANCGGFLMLFAEEMGMSQKANLCFSPVWEWPAGVGGHGGGTWWGDTEGATVRGPALSRRQARRCREM